MTSQSLPRQLLARGLTTVFALVCFGACAGQLSTDSYAGRSAIVYTPTKLPAFGTRALVVVLHGGLGNAQRIASERSESALNMNGQAEQGGFVVAYLNGTPVTRILGTDKLGWNAGNCCGVPAQKKVDDVAYIQQAVDGIAARYGIERSRIFGVGHSNGAMMTQRVMCETSLYAAAVPISGPLDTGAPSCPLARGKHLMAIHGADDQNVPIGGGRGTKGLSRTDFVSEAATAQVWQASGAVYDLQIVRGADHSIDTLNAQILKTESQTLAQKVARFLGLTAP
jgi:poly(3-hydroxybutyrate) depolymerase